MCQPSERPSLLEVSLVADSPCLLLGLRGELDVCNAHEVPRDDYASRPDLALVLLDLGELTFCDAAGVRALLELRRIHQAQGRPVAVVRANPVIWRLLGLCGVTDRLEEVAPPASTTATTARGRRRRVGAPSFAQACPAGGR